MDGAPEPHTSTRGFTLIEIAIVVAIVTMLLTLGLSLVNAQLSSAAVSVTKKRQEAIKDALIAYLGANKRLPCPMPGTATNGQETPLDPDLTHPACPQVGVVPFAALGISRETAEDGWGNRFSYRIYSDLSPNCQTVATGWDWGRRECFGEGKDNPAKSTLQVNDVAASTVINAIAVIVSHGVNGLGAWAAQGTPNVAPPAGAEACQEAYNARNAAKDDIPVTASPVICPATGNLVFYKGEREGNDDIVDFLTASYALQTLTKQGTIKSAIAKVNDDLQTLADMALGVKRAGIKISAIPSPCGGASEPSCSLAPSEGCAAVVDLSTTPLAPKNDPWGDQYVVDNPSGSFPICVCSKGGGSAPCQQSTCTTPPSNPPPFYKSIDRNSFNSYLAKTGSSGC